MTVIPLKSLPLGFRFHPTDEELVNHYLKGKITGRLHSDTQVIPEIDVCKCEPWDLPDKSLIRSDDHEWFFFAPVDRKYPNGHRSNRATGAGYWKATGKDRFIRSRTAPRPGIIGMKKTLVFHRGRAPKGSRTCWIMHEYRTTEPDFDRREQGGYMLYRLFKKPEETSLNCNGDEMVNGSYSQTNSKSSPTDVQLISEIEDCSALLEQTSAELVFYGEPSSQSLNQIIEEQSAVKWFAEKVDFSRDSIGEPEFGHCNALTTFDVANNNAEAKGRTVNVLEQFYDPYDEQTVDESFPNVASPIPYPDWSMYNIDYEPDHIDEVLHTMLSHPDKCEEDAQHHITPEFQSVYRKEDSARFATESLSSNKLYNRELTLPQEGTYVAQDKYEEYAQHYLTPEFQSIYRKKDSPRFAVNSVSISEVYDRESALPQEGTYVARSEKQNFEASLLLINSSHENPTRQHYGVLHDQTISRKDYSGRADIFFSMNSGTESVQSGFPVQGGFIMSSDRIKQETVQNLSGKSNRSESDKQWKNHMPAMQGLANRRLRLQKKEIIKKSQLAIGEENFQKLKDISSCGLRLAPKPSYRSYETTKRSSFSPSNILKTGAMIASMRRSALLVMFALLLVVLWRSVAVHVM